MAGATPIRRIPLSDVREVAVEAVKRIGGALEVVAANPLRDSTFVEILIVDTACEREPCRILVSVDRGVERSDLSDEIAGAVRHYLRGDH